MKTPVEVLKHLQSLASADGIAEYLKTYPGGPVKGDTGEPNSCPLANLFWKETGEKVEVHEGWIRVDGDPPQTVTFTEYPAVEEFVNEFDGGGFPHLDDDIDE